MQRTALGMLLGTRSGALAVLLTLVSAGLPSNGGSQHKRSATHEAHQPTVHRLRLPYHTARGVEVGVNGKGNRQRRRLATSCRGRECGRVLVV